jgi:hypothetical protein
MQIDSAQRIELCALAAGRLFARPLESATAFLATSVSQLAALITGARQPIWHHHAGAALAN